MTALSKIGGYSGCGSAFLWHELLEALFWRGEDRPQLLDGFGSGFWVFLESQVYVAQKNSPHCLKVAQNLLDVAHKHSENSELWQIIQILGPQLSLSLSPVYPSSIYIHTYIRTDM